jgi:hypothetical protein
MDLEEAEVNFGSLGSKISSHKTRVLALHLYSSTRLIA